MAKILINLLSKQLIPNYIAIKEIKPDKVVALATKEYINQIAIFEKLTNVPHLATNIDAYNLELNFNRLQNVINDMGIGNEIIVNYTGGTKIMTVSLILKVLLSVNQKLTFMYVNTFGNKIEYLNVEENKKLSTQNESIVTKVPLDIYIKLKGEKIKSFDCKPSNDITERFEMSEDLLLNENLESIFNKQKSFFSFKERRRLPKQSHLLTSDNYEIAWDINHIKIKLNNKKYEYKHSDGGAYFTGAWLEEYVFIKLSKAVKYDEILGNVKFDFTSFGLSDKPNPDEIFKNEIDIVVSKGLKTVFIECKAGYVSQDYVYKLKAIRDHFLGTFGEAVLVTKFPQKENIIEKCKDANIALISGKDISNIDISIDDLIKNRRYEN